MLKSANYKKGILRQSEFAPKHKVSAKQGARANSKQKKAKNAKRKRQKAKYKQKSELTR